MADNELIGIFPERLRIVIEAHALWLAGNPDGLRADLRKQKPELYKAAKAAQEAEEVVVREFDAEINMGGRGRCH